MSSFERLPWVLATVIRVAAMISLSTATTETGAAEERPTGSSGSSAMLAPLLLVPVFWPL